MEINIKDTTEAVVGTFGHSGPSLRGSMRVIIKASTDKGKACDANHVIAELKKEKFAINDHKTGELLDEAGAIKKVTTALQDMMYAGELKLVGNKDDEKAKLYHSIDKVDAKAPVEPVADDESDESDEDEE